MSRFTLAITLSSITLLSAGVVWVTNIRAGSDPTGLAETSPQEPGLERYIDSQNAFFFDFPKGLTVTVADETDSRFVFGDTSTGDTNFMVVSYPYELTEPLSEDVLLAQSSAADFIAPITRRSLPSGITAFLSQRARTPLGATKDAFFVHDGIIYQVSVVMSLDNLLTQILDSWRFAPPRPL